MKKKLELDDLTARSIYKTADNALKQILESTWGKDFFIEKLIDRVKSLSDIFKELGRKQLTLSDFDYLPVSQRKSALATYEITSANELLNEGWFPDFNNTNQYKYYSWWEKKASGWVFSFVSCRVSSSCMGSGFYSKDEKIAKFIATLLKESYNNLL